MGFTGTDGSLLQPALPLRAEDMEPMLEKLLKMLQTRLEAGLSVPDALPCFVATESFHKHKYLLQGLGFRV